MVARSRTAIQDGFSSDASLIGNLPPLTIPVYEPLIDPEKLAAVPDLGTLIARQSLFRNVVSGEGFSNAYIFGIEPDKETQVSSFSLARGRFLRTANLLFARLRTPGSHVRVRTVALAIEIQALARHFSKIKHGSRLHSPGFAFLLAQGKKVRVFNTILATVIGSQAGSRGKLC